MIPRKLQVLETFHSISKSQNSICDESQSFVFVSFFESWIFELFAVKSPIFKQGLGILVCLGLTVHHYINQDTPVRITVYKCLRCLDLLANMCSSQQMMEKLKPT